MNEQLINDVMGLVARLEGAVEFGNHEQIVWEREAIRAKLRDVVNISKKDQVDAECFRWWVHEAAANPGLVAKSISHCITEDEYREVICGAMVAKDAAIKIAKGAK